MQFMDAVALTGARVTSDGYLVADARIARTGVQTYAGHEVGRPDLAQVRVFRPENEVFAGAAMASMAHRPVTNDHPDEAVTAANWRSHAVGMTGAEVARDGEFVRVPMTVMDADAIEDVQAGKRELSVGYTCDLAWTPGETPTGDAYDAVQTNIRANHLAIVRAGRAGAQCRLGDHQQQPKERRVAELNRTVTVDTVSYPMTEQGAQLVGRLQGLLADAMSAMEAATARHTTALAAAMQAHQDAMAAKDAELGAKDAALADAAATGVTGAQLDRLVAERATVIGRAKALSPAIVTDGRSNAEIRRATVAARIGADKLTDKADAYVDALFDNLAAAGAVDPLRAAIIDARPIVTADARETAHARMVEDQRNAWKGA